MVTDCRYIYLFTAPLTEGKTSVKVTVRTLSDFLPLAAPINALHGGTFQSCILTFSK